MVTELLHMVRRVRMLPDRTLKTMLLELPIVPKFPSCDSYFEVDEKEKSGREKTEGDRISK